MGIATIGPISSSRWTPEPGRRPDTLTPMLVNHTLGLNYVSCSPYRVPVARLAAAQAAMETKRETAKRRPLFRKAQLLPVDRLLHDQLQVFLRDTGYRA